MKQIFRYSVGLAALVSVGCHRDLDVPECAKTSEGCVDAAGDSTRDSFEPVDSAVSIDAEPDGNGDDVGDSAVTDAYDASADVGDAGTETMLDVGPDTLSDAGTDACSTMTCTAPPAATCASATTRRVFASIGTCAAGMCAYTQTDTPCPPDQICSAGVCTPRSCAGALSCGSLGCCDWKVLPAGTFQMGRGGTGPEVDACSTWASDACTTDEQPEHGATVGSFGLDTFEVTVGRFRKFVDAYPASKPSAGAGAHVSIPGSGWQTAWNSNLPATQADLVGSLKCYAGLESWTDIAGPKESYAIDCVSWYVAFAFCAWDHARLPTEAEWEYAAAGGDEDRAVPWGSTAPNSTLVNGGCTSCSGSMLPVGSKPLGVSRWGQYDLAGNALEWTLDAYAPYTATAKNNYANLTGASRVLRGSNYALGAGTLRSAMRGWYEAPNSVSPTNGFRCAH